MEGQRRFLKAYQNATYWSYFYYVMSSFYDSTWIERLKFKDKVLDVEIAVEPELLYW
jgi:hypothetical protein